MEETKRAATRIRGTSRALQKTAVTLRREMTHAERILWDNLKDRRLAGLKFRAQHPLHRFILDFYCPALHLVIEIDGEIHSYQTEHVEERTRFLKAIGYRVLRFQNEEVIHQLPTVLQRIKAAASVDNDI